jgi:glutamate synthase (NADPH/NADH) small chain
MGMIKGFLEYARETGAYLPVEERIRHFREFYRLPSEEGLKVQGARCMDCGIPYCHSWGCPNGNLIPEWNDLVYRGRWREAYDRLAATSALPEVTGRVCPAPCEASCTLSINSAPVAIKDLELAIIEKAFDQGWVVPEVPAHETGKKVAVVGSGPAGLAAARELRRSGFRVTVFEKEDRPGGLLRYGIPNFKLEKEIIDRRIEVMERGGIDFETLVTVGKDLSLSYLQRRFDAVLLALGAGVPRDVPAGGRGLEGIHFALEYLSEATRAVQAGRSAAPALSAEGKRVLVIGGGDTGSDCVGTAVRQGAREVYQYEIMPEPRSWNKSWNPEWPRWPQILRTSSSQAEGCRRDWGVSTRRFSGRDIRVEEAHFVRVEWKPDSRKGGMSPVEIPGSEFSQPVDLVLLALGFLHVEPEGIVKTLGLKRDGRGNLEVDHHGRTSIPGIWAAGDCGSGASLVIRAMESGSQAAEDLKRQI